MSSSSRNTYFDKWHNFPKSQPSQKIKSSWTFPFHSLISHQVLFILTNYVSLYSTFILNSSMSLLSLCYIPSWSEGWGVVKLINIPTFL